MMDIQRKNIKYNFLKTIIVRFDFQGVFDSEMEKLLPLIKPYLKEKNFTRYTKRKNNTLEVNFNSAVLQTPILNNVQNQIIHSFINDDSGYVLDISNSFVCLNIRSTSYSPFEEYNDLISYIIKFYKKHIDFFSVTRIGIRKINECILKDKNKINEFFSQDYFRYFSLNKDVHNFFSDKKDTFGFCDKYKGNLSCKIEQGEINSAEHYKLTLDIDIYIDNIQLINETNDYKLELEEMNNIIFDIFVNALTEKLKQALVADENDFKFNDDLLGVERNE